jgi:hypothetical protein
VTRRRGVLAGALVAAVAAGVVAVIVLGSAAGGLPGGSAAAPPGTAVAFRTCARRTVVPRPAAVAAGLNTWPDGTFGVVRRGGRDVFIGADGGRGPAVTTGTAGDPLAFGVSATASLAVPHADYASGGPVYRVPGSRRWLLFYHAERWPGGNPAHFYSWIGMAVSTNSGRSWRDLGEIIRPQRPYSASSLQIAEVAGGPFVVAGGYFYVYFRDVLHGGTSAASAAPPTAQLSVARAPVDVVLRAAADGHVAVWHDFDAGRWNGPALGGAAGPLETGNPPTRWFDVGYDPAVKRYILLVANDDDRTGQRVNLFIAFSRDGLRWTPRQRLTAGAIELFYPTLVATGRDPLALGRTFDVYFTSARAGGFRRWTDAVLDRMTIRLAARCA